MKIVTSEAFQLIFTTYKLRGISFAQLQMIANGGLIHKLERKLQDLK